MKNTFKATLLFFLSLFVISCNNDDDNSVIFEENINADRFTGIELGNSQFVLPQSNVDIHTEFDYAGTSKVTKILFDVTPFDVPVVRDGEVSWELSNHLVPVERYEGQLNPHIHYHVYFDEENKYEPSFKPAEGVYKFKITAEHEDGSKSIVTKDLHIIQKFKDMKVGDNNVAVLGTDKLQTIYQYVSGNNTVTEIKYQLWFKEWREGQNVEVGKWDNVEMILPKESYNGKKNPMIDYMYNLPEGIPTEGYWLNIYVTEGGESEAVKLSVPFEVK
ncbi:hypothetical protein [Aquimarina sp. I32.4]|uniref:hypothetical protein n=1 Tax=Aquimarina sp. I32.4 TaxID=2053903 RepID=UPI0011AF0C79|nr:hypothetical protein [Aquimarina sp. I32.4]